MNENNKPKPEWLDRVKATHRFHISKVIEHPKSWSLSKTASLLKRSVGAISQELTVARWLKTHSSQLEQFELFQDAIEFCRERKHKLLEQELSDD